jgi:hypothetical protein
MEAWRAAQDQARFQQTNSEGREAKSGACLMPRATIETASGKTKTIEYDDHTPLRLDIAAKIAFPDGTMGTAGLRSERDAGRLVTEMIAGKEFVTIASILDMRLKCRGLRKGKPSASSRDESREIDNSTRVLALAKARKTLEDVMAAPRKR